MLYYTIHSKSIDSPWITFIHGAGGSSTIWYKQIRYFSRYFNLLLVDLRGHGKSKPNLGTEALKKYTFSSITKDVLEVLDHEKIAKSHFVGISLGTIIIRQLAEWHPERIQSMVMGGAILKFNFCSRVLMHCGNWTKSILPYMWIYKLFAFIIMPYKNHKESRLLFINEAKKLYQKEFIRWYKLTAEVLPLLRFFRQAELPIPTLYIMGAEDYMFLPAVEKVVAMHATAQVAVLPQCGHVVNVEKPTDFNTEMHSFLQQKK
ncbi:MAG: alpha/beta hydrolase [Bacteroidetes bacterium]|nr:alpha/beta hydrolase [Bacteroidota bacterium]MDA0937539.1 alpha/beta hydrolase [Bacteroidota bacterium]MDA1345062.1 alpha/beta hydrolase [Bacteroidota bacterium]